MGQRIGVDIGGSFTDFAVLDEATRQVRALKVFSRPDQPGAEVLHGIAELGERYGIAPDDITYFTHGTTVGVNTVIQRKGLRLALLTTEHFSDVLELGRLKLPSMFDLLSKRPEPLVERALVFGISERILANGSIDQELDPDSLSGALRLAIEGGAEGIVISFLHSYRNDVNELAAKRQIQKLAPHLPVFTSSEIWPVIREFERTMTAVIGGYVQPRVAHYLGSLQTALKQAGVTAEARVSKSNGGVMSAEQGKRDCVQMILSGTASGVIGAAFVARLCGIEECMSLDVGGTSADVALIIDGKPQYGVGEYIGDHQIHIPSVSVTSIGDGGGSIAWVDQLGLLRVGPESAGSTPGPACYGRGGIRPTITDAFAVCGIVGQEKLGYNAVTADIGKARTAIATLAGPLGRSLEETAEAIIQIAISGMFAKVSGMVTRFGIDPRSMAMLAFGGAGPMMGCLLARELDMVETVIPTVPGVLSALGGLIADLRNDFIKTVYVDFEPSVSDLIRTEFSKLKETALHWLRHDQNYDGEAVLTYSADMRYRGQSYEIEAVFGENDSQIGNLSAIAAAFHDAHERIYGHADLTAPLQIVNLRLIVTGKTPTPELPRIAHGLGAPTAIRQIEVWIEGGSRAVPLYRRSDLLAGQAFDGPAVVVQDDTTTYVPPGGRVAVDAFGNLRIKQL